jgi:hypothetical protein
MKLQGFGLPVGTQFPLHIVQECAPRLTCATRPLGEAAIPFPPLRTLPVADLVACSWVGSLQATEILQILLNSAQQTLSRLVWLPMN